MLLQAESHFPEDRTEIENELRSPLLMVSRSLTVLSLLRRCFLALVLLLSSTSHAVGRRPTSTSATHPAITPRKQNDQVQACHPYCRAFQCNVPIAAPLDTLQLEEIAESACFSPGTTPAGAVSCELEAWKAGQALLTSI